MGTRASTSLDTRGDGSAEAGFTLVELMVVLALMAIAGATVMLAMPDGRGALREDAERFAARVRAAEELAITLGRPVAVVVTPGGYRFEERLAGGWRPLATRPFQPQRWRDGTGAATGLEGARALLDPTGLAESLAVPLRRGAAGMTVRIDGDGTIDVAG